ncbi:Serine/Threonine protein kinases active-site signature [Nakaseomyces glabratus]|nr:Serine/Threonine protein kinases active-site signature [Nakaseomyces glabratus]KAH7590467.1 Serine/Threonine protein kinases active-site signature [Nakaseomyces glabratus]KAI8396177.1 Serine/Threonine protein kinases active-site signature [Nakaseomyces glabratus]
MVFDSWAVAKPQATPNLEDVRKHYENLLYEDLENLDDPLQLYLEYIKHLKHCQNEGQGISCSQVLQDVMERCLLYFLDLEIFKNDPRLLRVWISYMNMVYKEFIDEKINILCFLYHKKIAVRLALFYEQLAECLASINKGEESVAILRLGKDNNAFPTQRIIASYEQYALKYGTTNDNNNMYIQFMNTYRIPTFIMNYDSSNLSPIPLRHIRKEDVTNLDNKNDNTSKTLNEEQNDNDDLIPQSKPKIPIFHDSESPEKNSKSNKSQVLKVVEMKGKKPQKIVCNFKLLFPDDSQEYCIEEILAKSSISRDILRKKQDRVKRNLDLSVTNSKADIKRRNILSDKITGLPSTQPPIPGLNTENKDVDTKYEVDSPVKTKIDVSTSILPLKEAPMPGMTSKQYGAPSSPTVTMFSKNAMNEVYSMFNQNYEDFNGLGEKEDTTSKFSQYENFTEGFTAKNLDDLTEAKPNIIRTDVGEISNSNVRSPIRAIPNKSKLPEFMTPIKETARTLLPRNKIKIYEDKPSSVIPSQSSPFISQPIPKESNSQGKEIPEYKQIINHPTSKKFRLSLLTNIQPPLSTYSTFYSYNQNLKMSSHLKKMHKASKIENKRQILEFKKADELYCIVGELGQGGYATVYLAESDRGDIRALKVETPSSSWEYYILKQIENRLQGDKILDSVISAYSLHFFLDESYLVLNFANQGTILDLVNYYGEKSSNSVDECLCIFLSLELIKIVLRLHDVGIIHGDLKPDNCMIRFSDGLLGNYDKHGGNGWHKKGIYLIDFGRSFDMKLFDKNTKFIADWTTDMQDCPAMRKGDPWSFEADYYGLASIVYCMLFGKTIEIDNINSGTYRIRGTIKRYWNHDIWNPLFDILLNPSSTGSFSMKIETVVSRMEDYLSVMGNSQQLRSIIYDLQPELIKIMSKKMSLGKRKTSI